MIEYVDRDNTHSLKWDYIRKKYPNIIPAWVADMDYKTSPVVLKEMEKMLHLGAFGYTYYDEQYLDSVINWYKSSYDVEIFREDILFSPGVVSSLSFIIKVLTNKNDKVIINTPVYHPFYSVIEDHQRKINRVPLLIDQKNVEIDWSLLNKLAKESSSFILCSPHNPIGRVWSLNELKKIEEIVLKNHLLLVVDEIHCDLTLWGNSFNSILSLSNELLNRTVVLNSVSKTFNLAGLQTSNIISKNKRYLNKLKQEMHKYGLFGPNYFAMVATVSAYNYGKPWLDELKKIIEKNILLLKDNINFKEYYKFYIPEATYLVWLDFSTLFKKNINLTVKKFEKLLIDNGVYVNMGNVFGEEGKYSIRINVATSQKNILKISNSINNTINSVLENRI